VSYTKQDMLEAFQTGFECRGNCTFGPDEPMSDEFRSIIRAEFESLIAGITTFKTAKKDAGPGAAAVQIAENIRRGRPKYWGLIFREQLEIDDDDEILG